MTNPRTQGIKMNPIKNVTDPQSIKASEIPSSSDANPAGEICVVVGRLDVYTSGECSENGAGEGGDRSRLRTRAESS